MEKEIFKPAEQQPEEVFDINPEVEGETMHIGEGFINDLVKTIKEKGMMVKMDCDEEAIRTIIGMFSPKELEDLIRRVREQK